MDWLLLTAAVAGAAVMTALGGLAPALDVLAVAVVLAALARLQPRAADGRAILLAALAVSVLAVFRLACDSMAVVWLAADALGHGLGLLAGGIAGRPLAIGGSFAGIDYLVLMTALAAAWLASTKAPRGRRALTAAAAILLGQFAYLLLLAWTPDLLGHLPEVVKPQVTDMSRLGTWTWGNAARSLLPWNLPAVALLIQAGIAGALFRWAAWLPPGRAPMPTKESGGRTYAIAPLLGLGAAVLAAAIPLLVVLDRGEPTLQGRTIAACDAEGFHLLPELVASLGGRFLPWPDLAQADLAKADVLLLPASPSHFSPEQSDRLWKFVRSGGSLLVMATPEGKETAAAALAPTSLSLRGDAAVAATRNWEDVCQATPSLATAGVDATRGGFGLDRPGTLRVRLVGPAAAGWSLGMEQCEKHGWTSQPWRPCG